MFRLNDSVSSCSDKTYLFTKSAATTSTLGMYIFVFLGCAITGLIADRKSAHSLPWLDDSKI